MQRIENALLDKEFTMRCLSSRGAGSSSTVFSKHGKTHGKRNNGGGASWGGKTSSAVMSRKTSLLEASSLLGKGGLRFGLKEKAEEAKKSRKDGRSKECSRREGLVGGSGFSFLPRGRASASRRDSPSH